MVKIPAVLDCACLIGLERIGQLPLLPALLEPVIAPPAVVAEFGHCPAWLTEEAPLASPIPIQRTCVLVRHLLPVSAVAVEAAAKDSPIPAQFRTVNCRQGKVSYQESPPHVPPLIKSWTPRRCETGRRVLEKHPESLRRLEQRCAGDIGVYREAVRLAGFAD